MKLTCPRCGEELEALKLQTLCLKCVTKAYFDGLLAQEREVWRTLPPKEVELTREKGRVSHAVLGVNPGWTYCGREATEPRRQRRRVFPEEIVALGMCPECQIVFRPLYAAAVQGRAVQGG